MRGSRVVLLLGLLSAGAGLVFACRSPTQIVVHLATDVSCSQTRGVVASGAENARTAETKPSDLRSTPCTQRASESSLGNFVTVPSGESDAAVAYRIVLGVDRPAAECTRDNAYFGCIVARRRLRYLPHASLDLTVRLMSACKNKPCGETETCVEPGVCVSAELDPEDCARNPGCAPRAPSVGLDGGLNDAAAPDASPDSGSQPGPTCTGALSGSPWPMPMGCWDQRGQAVARTIARAGLTLRGNYDLQGRQPSHVVVNADGNRIYFALRAGNDVQLVALDGRGSEVWLRAASRNAYAGTTGPLLADDGKIYLLGERFQRFAVDGTRELDIDDVSLSDGVSGALLGPDGFVYASSGDRVVSFTREGVSRWTWAAPSGRVVSLAVDASGTLFVTDLAKTRALRTEVGATTREIWQSQDVGNAIAVMPRGLLVLIANPNAVPFFGLTFLRSDTGVRVAATADRVGHESTGRCVTDQAVFTQLDTVNRTIVSNGVATVSAFSMAADVSARVLCDSASNILSGSSVFQPDGTRLGSALDGGASPSRAVTMGPNGMVIALSDTHLQIWSAEP